MTAAAHTSGSVARLVGGTLVGRDDLPVTGLATVAEAGPGHLTFIGDLVNANRWAASKAGTAVVTKGIAVSGHDPATRALIEVESADLAMIPVLELYFRGDPLPEPGIAPGAHVHPTATVDPTARIAA
ncbi:MAG: LpxD N-terminal domain-containing protein, partial [Phycisphaerales bacterium]